VGLGWQRFHSHRTGRFGWAWGIDERGAGQCEWGRTVETNERGGGRAPARDAVGNVKNHLQLSQ